MLSKKIYVLFVFSFFLSVFYCTDSLKINYLERIPVIDGKPDTFIKNLILNKFSFVESTDSNIVIPKAEYFISYNLQSLYLMIEVEAEKITYRDRAYQNGDGFHITIANPAAEGKETDEFYVLRFSPGENNKAADSRIWYYNKDLRWQILQNTKLATSEANGKIYFELLMSWKDIPPYQPFWKQGVGFNLSFVKAAGENEKIIYYALYDKKIQWEQNPRKYIQLKFIPPSVINYDDSFAELNKGNIREGEKSKCNFYFYSATEKTDNIGINIKTADNNIKRLNRENMFYKKGINQFSFELNTQNLIEDGYFIEWWIGNKNSEFIPLTVLPAIDIKKLKIELINNFQNISSGTKNTMIFRLNEADEDFSKLKFYETAGELREKLKTIKRDFELLTDRDDFYKNKKGIFRRAYFEKKDNTYQPYSVKIPVNYNSAKKYPLIVLLHGSGQDDRGMLENADMSRGEYIEVAPNGRGVSNCFATEESQKNIEESIKDVIKNYNIDETRILLAGFSMGGYGVFRTVYEHPERYKAMAVFSGHPDLGNKWLEGNHPDFTNKEYLSKFNNKSIFIYHDKGDRNCPYELMLKTVEKLTDMGCKVKFIETTGEGHSLLNKQNIDEYYKWLDKNL